MRIRSWQLITNKHLRGAVILVIVFVLLGTISLLVLYFVNAGVIGGRVIANEYRTQQAFEAAEAGLNYGIVYLQRNKDKILVDSNNNGTIDANSTNQTLNNGSSFTVSFTNPVANNFDLITITAVGTDADGNASKQITQLTKFISYIQYYSPLPITGKGKVELKGSSMVRNLITEKTIWSGGDIAITGSSHTESKDGLGSSKTILHTDIALNDSALGNLSDNDFFANFFAASEEEIKNSATSYYTGNETKIYHDELEGKQNELRESK